ncbi:MAG: VanZ family protein [Candidatus Omnitrophota bacterium]
MSIKNRKAITDSLIYMGFILILCSIPYTSSKIYLPMDIINFLHVPMFGLLGFLWMRAFKYNERRYSDALFQAIVICAIYGAFTEFYQSFIPGRYPSMADFVFDATGGALGAIIYRYNKK